jgi:hypothetical protein
LFNHSNESSACDEKGARSIAVEVLYIYLMTLRQQAIRQTI